VKHILFVCTGNTCRSPLAEYLLRDKAGQELEVRSAGIAAFDGSPAAANVQTLLVEKGIQPHHTSQTITPELIEWADLILTMTKNHKQVVHKNFPHSANKLHTLKEYVASGDPVTDISDPYGGSLDTYRRTMVELDGLLNQLVGQGPAIDKK
jgi:protein-tyrosine-phosphatase